MPEYNMPPNSNKFKEDQKKKLEPVVKGPVKIQKKSGAKRFAESIFSGDRTNIKDDIVYDLVVPSIRDLIFDALYRMLEGLFYSRGERRSRNKPRGNYVSYDSYSKDRDREPRGRRSVSSWNVDEMVYPTYEEAHAVLDIMTELVGQYHMVSIAEMKDASNVTPDNYTDEYYGWTDLSDAYISKVRDGYLLHLPKVVQLP